MYVQYPRSGLICPLPGTLKFMCMDVSMQGDYSLSPYYFQRNLSHYDIILFSSSLASQTISQFATGGGVENRAGAIGIPWVGVRRSLPPPSMLRGV